MNVYDNLTNGEYSNSAPYPDSPRKPILSRYATPTEHRQHADLLEIYEAARLVHRENLKAWNSATSDLEDQFRWDLEAEHGIEGHPKAALLFILAQDRGHSAGLHEVYGEYERLVELIK